KLDADLLMVMIASHWDLAEPATYAPHLLQDALPGSTTKRILDQIGRYDAQVPNVASDIAARTIGLPLLSPPVHPVFGLTETQAPTDSAYVIYDVGSAPTPLGTIAPTMDNATHEGVRRIHAAQLQM